MKLLLLSLRNFNSYLVRIRHTWPRKLETKTKNPPINTLQVLGRNNTKQRLRQNGSNNMKTTSNKIAQKRSKKKKGHTSPESKINCPVAGNLQLVTMPNNASPRLCLKKKKKKMTPCIVWKYSVAQKSLKRNFLSARSESCNETVTVSPMYDIRNVHRTIPLAWNSPFSESLADTLVICKVSRGPLMLLYVPVLPFPFSSLRPPAWLENHAATGTRRSF